MSTDVNTGASALPDDFAAYEAMRRGETPPEVENPSGATADTAAAGSDSDSETDKDLESLPAGDDAGEGEGDEEEEEEEETPKPKKGKGGFQKRIQKLSARAQQLESERPRKDVVRVHGSLRAQVELENQAIEYAPSASSTSSG